MNAQDRATLAYQQANFAQAPAQSANATLRDLERRKNYIETELANVDKLRDELALINRMLEASK